MLRKATLLTLILLALAVSANDWSPSLRIALQATASPNPTVHPRPFAFVDENLIAEVTLGYYWTGESRQPQSRMKEFRLPRDWAKSIVFELRDEQGRALDVEAKPLRFDDTTRIASGTRVSATFDLGVLPPGDYTVDVRMAAPLKAPTAKTWVAIRRGNEDRITRHAYLLRTLQRPGISPAAYRDTLLALVQYEPSNAELHERLADAAAERGAFDEARQRYTRAAEIVSARETAWRKNHPEEKGPDFETYRQRLVAIRDAVSDSTSGRVKVVITWSAEQKQYQIFDRSSGRLLRTLK
jgi:hypothetical protein